MQTDTKVNAPVIPQVEEIILGKFSGALSRFQLTAYNDLLEVKLPAKVAHKVAMDFGSDLGRLMASDADFKSKVGKADKHGNSRINISGGGKIATYRSMSVVRLSQQLGTLADEDLVESADITLVMSSNLADYIKDCEAWAKDRVFKTIKGLTV